MGSAEYRVLSPEKEVIAVMTSDTGRKVEKFEDLIAWQRARGLTMKIYHFNCEAKDEQEVLSKKC